MLFVLCVSGALQISDSQETDQGKYECVAENSVGTQHATAIMLWVRGECIIFRMFHYYIFTWPTEQTHCVPRSKTQLCVKTKNKLD